jgi:hypothetical protein
MHLLCNPSFVSDAAGALSRAELNQSLQLDALLQSAREGPVSVLECSAAKATGIEATLDATAKALQQSTPAQ